MAKHRGKAYWEQEVVRSIRELRTSWKPTREYFHEGYTKHRLLPGLTGTKFHVGQRVFVGCHGLEGFVAGFVNHSSYCLILWDDGTWSCYPDYELTACSSWHRPCGCGSLACAGARRKFKNNRAYRPRGLSFHGVMTVPVVRLME